MLLSVSPVVAATSTWPEAARTSTSRPTATSTGSFRCGALDKAGPRGRQCQALEGLAPSRAEKRGRRRAGPVRGAKSLLYLLGLGLPLPAPPPLRVEK